MIKLLEILKEAQGMDTVLDLIVNKHPRAKSYKQNIQDFILKSGAPTIEIQPIKASGASLHDKVILNPIVFDKNLANILYTIFHEIAHQYQYRKYGEQKMYDFYLGEVPIDELASFMKYIENVADDFALRKLREFVKLGLLTQEEIQPIKPYYKDIPTYHFEYFINEIRKLVKKYNITSPEKISELLYNYIKIKND